MVRHYGVECNCRLFWLLGCRSLVLQSAYFSFVQIWDEKKKLQIFVLERTSVLQVQCAYWNFAVLLYGWLNSVEAIKRDSTF